MGIDYAPGTLTKVVDCPSEASEMIRKCLMSIPDGYVYEADDIDDQISRQRAVWRDKQKARRAAHKKKAAAGRAKYRQELAEARQRRSEQEASEKLARQLNRITSSQRWQKLKQAYCGCPQEQLPASVQNGTEHALHNVLIVGSRHSDVPDDAVHFVARMLGPHCSLFAGTPDGNPGAVLAAALQDVPQPEVRLYQPQYMQTKREASFGGFPVVFAGPGKDDMRRQMIADAHAVLAIGGAEGTLQEVLLAISTGKPTFLIKGYGPVPAYVLDTKRWGQRPNVKGCQGLAEAVQDILDMSKV
jgi:hypothetical protein